MFSAKEALAHGLVDRLQSAHDFYKTLMPKQEEDATRPSFGFNSTAAARARLEMERHRF